MATSIDDFDYDTAGDDAGARTFEDQQPQRDGNGGDKFARLRGVQANVAEPTGPTKCTGTYAQSRIIDKEGVTYVSYTLTSTTSDPPGVIGYRADVFGPVAGTDEAKCARTLRDLSALARAAGVKWVPNSLEASLKAIDAAAGKPVKYRLKPGTKGGVFVNF